MPFCFQISRIIHERISRITDKNIYCIIFNIDIYRLYVFRSDLNTPTQHMKARHVVIKRYFYFISLLHIRMYVYVRVYLPIFMYVCKFVYVPACVRLSQYTSMHVFTISLRMQACVQLCLKRYECVHASVQAWACACAHVPVCFLCTCLLCVLMCGF